jgi:hypothetical protein
MLGDADFEIIGVADVKTAVGAMEHVGVESHLRSERQ